MTDIILHGAAYYPEQRGLDKLDADVAVMKELGLNVVRMGEFCWSTVEREEGKFDFSLFDEAIARLAANGIKTIMSVPTATPPVWFTKKHPESRVVNRDGRTMIHGSREHVCMNNEDYVAVSVRITKAFGEHFGKNENIVAWQIHNEPGCPTYECFCDSCKGKWQEYLKRRYKSISRLNDAFDAKVWSREYEDFKDVEPPFPTSYLHSCSLESAYRVFSSSSVANFISILANELRRYVSVPLTTNVCNSFRIDFGETFKDLDFYSIDEYSAPSDFPAYMAEFDLAKCLSKLPYIVMETPPTYAGNRIEVLPYCREGYIRGLAQSALLGGGNGFLYWQFNQSRGGAEITHGHIIDACGNLTPAEKNVKSVSAAIKHLGPFLRKTEPCKGDAAIYYGDKARMYSEAENLKEFDYLTDFRTSYKAFTDLGIYREIVTDGSDFSEYRLIYVPYALYISSATVDKMFAAASDGSTVIFGAYTGIRDENHLAYTDFVLGEIERKVGKKCKYFTGLKENGEIDVFGVNSPISGHVGITIDEKYGKITGGFLDGSYAISETNYGKGKIVIAEFKPSPESEKSLISRYIKPEDKLFGEKTEISGIACYKRRDKRGKVFRCYVNTSDKAVEIRGNSVAVGQTLIESEDEKIII